MSRVLPYLKRAPRLLMFWLIVAVFAVALLRSFFPNEGFDEVRTGEVPLEVAASDAGVWVLNYGDHSVSLIDPATAEEQFEVEVGDDVGVALSANDEGAWVVLDGGASIGRIDPDEQAVAETYDVGAVIDDGTKAQDLAAGDGVVWVTTGDGGQMVRVDTASGDVADPVDLGGPVAQPQILGDSVWVNLGSSLAERDGASGEEVRVVETDHRIHDFVAAEDALWLLSDVDNFEETGLVVRVNPEDSSEDGRLRILDTRPSHLTAYEDLLFVTGSEGQLLELGTDPLSIEATELVTVSTKNLKGVVVHEGVVWAADGTNGVVHQPLGGIEGEAPTETTLL